MDIALTLIKLADGMSLSEMGAIADRHDLDFPGGSHLWTAHPPHASMGALRELEGQDPTLNPRIAPGGVPLSDRAHLALDPAADHIKQFFSTPGGQIAAAAGLLGLGALSHHIATKGHHRPLHDED